MKIKPVHLFRIGLGVDMLMHGAVRIPHLDAFVSKTTAGMKGTFLPDVLIHPFLIVLPFIEGLLGLMILVGGKTGRWGLVGGGLFMTVLLFGATSHQDWAIASQQITYLTAFALALYFHDKETSILS